MAIRILLIVAVTVVLNFSTAGRAAAKPLNPKQVTFLKQQAIPAYRQGGTGFLLEPLAKFVSGLDQEGRSQAEQILRDSDGPPLAHLLLSARMAGVQRGGKFMEPRPKTKEMLLLLSYLDQEIAGIIARVQELPALDQPPPRPQRLTGYEMHFWDLDRADSTLAMGQFFVKEAMKLQELGSRLDHSALDDQARAAVDADLRIVLGRLAGLRRDVSERAVRLRLQRLEDSAKVLEKSDDLKSRWRAAYFVDSDGAFLSSVFDQTKVKEAEDGEHGRPRFRDAALNDPHLAVTVGQYVEDGLKAAGELTAKTRMLHAGLAWWLRGRYGRGSNFMGLLKGPAALDSAAALFAVAMPASLPAATDPSDTSQRRSPAILRRHHHTWAWEERTVRVKSVSVIERGAAWYPSAGYLAGGAFIHAFGDLSFFAEDLGEWAGTFYMGNLSGPEGSGSLIGRRQTDMTQYAGAGQPFKDIEERIYERTTTLTKIYLPSERADIVKRIVGFVEFAQALDYFDRLLATTSPEERHVIDELIAEDERYTVYTNLSRLVQKRPSTLNEASVDARDSFKRTGLGWVMGLARVELAAMLSAFAYRDEAFGVVMRNEFGGDEYKELVQDGMRTHLAMLQRDPYVRQAVSNKAPVNRMLAYLRRVSLAKAFVKAAGTLSRNEYVPAQWFELKRWMDDLTGTQASLMLNIHSHLATSKDIRQQKWYENVLPEFRAQYEYEKAVRDELRRRGHDPDQILNQ